MSLLDVAGIDTLSTHLWLIDQQALQCTCKTLYQPTRLQRHLDQYAQRVRQLTAHWDMTGIIRGRRLLVISRQFNFQLLFTVRHLMVGLGPKDLVVLVCQSDLISAVWAHVERQSAEIMTCAHLGPETNDVLLRHRLARPLAKRVVVMLGPHPLCCAYEYCWRARNVLETLPDPNLITCWTIDLVHFQWDVRYDCVVVQKPTFPRYRLDEMVQLISAMSSQADVCNFERKLSILPDGFALVYEGRACFAVTVRSLRERFYYTMTRRPM